MKIGVNRMERFAVVGRIGLDRTGRSCSLVAVVEGNLPALPTAARRRTLPVRRHIRHHSLAEVDDSHQLAVAEGWSWSAKPRDGAREGCWIRLQ